MASYSFGWREASGAAPGGKGVRQALAVLGADAAGVPAACGGAVAVELDHAFSLVHDDIMDGDTHRRGRPSGGLRHRTRGTDRGRAVRAGTRPWTGPERVHPSEYLDMAERKTGALLGCAVSLGAALGGASTTAVAALDRAGRQLGIAFQIVDDVLGIWGDPAVTGKPAHGDLRERKKTYPVLAALSSPAAARLEPLLAAGETDAAAALIEECGAREAALAASRRHTDAARSALAAAEAAPGVTDELRCLLDHLVRRDL